MKATKGERYRVVANGDTWWVMDDAGRVVNAGTLPAMTTWLLFQINNSTHELRIRKSRGGYVARVKRIDP